MPCFKHWRAGVDTDWLYIAFAEEVFMIALDQQYKEIGII